MDWRRRFTVLPRGGPDVARSPAGGRLPGTVVIRPNRRPPIGLIAITLVVLGLAGALLAPRVRVALALRRHTAIHATAEDVTKAYSERPQYAAMRFGDKVVELSGFVGGFDEGIIGDGAIHLAGDGGHEVMCYFDGGLPLPPGTEMRVCGICAGTDDEGNVVVDHCQIVGP